jgi:hypothetical protein
LEAKPLLELSDPLAVMVGDWNGSSGRSYHINQFTLFQIIELPTEEW